MQTPASAHHPKARTGPEHTKHVLEAIQQVRNRQLLMSNSFWTVFHGILGNGLDTTLLNTETKQKVPAVEYIAPAARSAGCVSW